MANRVGVSAVEEGVLTEEHPGADLKGVQVEHPPDGGLRLGGELPAVAIVLGEDLDAQQLGSFSRDADAAVNRRDCILVPAHFERDQCELLLSVCAVGGHLDQTARIRQLRGEQIVDVVVDLCLVPVAPASKRCIDAEA